MRWQDVLADRQLQDLPYKIELNRWGQIVMSPAKAKHGIYQGLILRLLESAIDGGLAFPECPIMTEDNVKVADVVWASSARAQQIADEDAASIAPEICIEVLSASNSAAEIDTKRELYFKAGAEEVWICSGTGEVKFFDRQGPIVRSQLAPAFPLQVRWPE